MASFYDTLVTELDLQVPTAIHKTDEAIHVNVRADEQASYYFVTNFSDVEQTFTVTTPMQDLLTGTKVGVGTYSMSAYDSKVLVKEG